MNIAQTELQKFEALVASLVAEWQKIKPNVTGWFSIDKIASSKAFQFVLSGIKQLVSLAQTIEAAGVDKKAIVLAAANKLFNTVVMIEVPLALQPFAMSMQSEFDALLDGAIEFLVAELHGVSPVPAPTPTPTPVPATT